MATFFKAGFGSTDTGANTMAGAVSISATNNYMTFEYPQGTDYQVPSGKTLYITRVSWYSVSAVSELALGYGDTGVADGGSAPTNFLRIGSKMAGGTSNTMFHVDGVWSVPATKYPCARSLTNAIECVVFGILV